LAIVLTAVLMAGLDSSVLNVAIPTILRDFHTTLPQLQWVITGYSLTFAALLIIGGRLVDIHGARQVFVAGAFLFGVGSLIAALSTGVVMLVIGEAIIEGIGASLMLPASLAILTSTFHGRERGTAFSMWAAAMGAAYALGPVLGGFLTTQFSWRWAFLINVIAVPFAILGILVLTRREPRSGRREPIDVPGAILVASGMALLVFAISEGESYGWWKTLKGLTIAGTAVWPADRIVSPVPVAFVLACVLLFGFYRVERRKERERRSPLFEFGQLRHLGFRYGLTTLVFLAMGQVAFVLVLSVVLQNAQHLSAFDTGLWLVPAGISIVVGSQIGGWLTRKIATVVVVRIGLFLLALGLGVTAAILTPTVTFVSLLPCFALFGLGIGFAGSQLTNVVLQDIPADKAGAASGANSTVRMIGAALGIAVISAMLSAFTVHYALDNIRHAERVSDHVEATAVAQVRTSGVNYEPAPGTPTTDAAALESSVSDAIASAARPSMIFATAVVSLGLLLSFLIPRSQAEADEVDPELLVEAELIAEGATIQ
jgi:EmrB/QacA subfamily drug resistance transporter